MGELERGRIRVLSRGGHVPARVIQRPWPRRREAAGHPRGDELMFHIGLPYLSIENDGRGGLCIVGRGPAQVLLGRMTIAGTEIRRACGATSQSRWSSLHYLALETTTGETYVLELSPANLAEVLGYLTVAGAHVDPQPCTWSYRPGGVTLSPRPAEPE